MSHSTPTQRHLPAQPLPSLTLLIPFSFPPAQFRKDLARQMTLPALALATSRPATAPRRQTFDAYAPVLPYERWLMQAIPGCATLAATLAASCGLQPAQWKLLQPSHINVARDHLALTSARQLALDDTESRTLLEQIRPWAAEAGCELHYIDPLRWLIRNDHWNALATCTPDAAAGHDIDIWMPKGDKAREWRRLHNEIQMSWHESELNQSREQQGKLPVNALWLWGAEKWQDSEPDAGQNTNAPPVGDFATGPDGTGTATQPPDSIPGQWLIPGFQHASADNSALPAADVLPRLVTADLLSDPAVAGDWGSWAARFEQLDQTLLGPALERVRARQISHLTLVLSDQETLVSYRVTAASLGITGTIRALGRKPGLKSWIDAGSQMDADD